MNLFEYFVDKGCWIWVCLKWGNPTHVYSNWDTDIPGRTGHVFPWHSSSETAKFVATKHLPPCNARQAEDTFVSAKRNKHIWAKKQAQIFSSTNKRRDLKGRGAGCEKCRGQDLGLHACGESAKLGLHRINDISPGQCVFNVTRL